MIALKPKYTVLKDGKYELAEPLVYFSPRYGKFVTAAEGMISDGATGALDIYSASWLIHDRLCNDCHWDDGKPLTNWQASHVIGDILAAEGHWFRARTWAWSTWLFGCSKCRDNGMFTL